MSLPFLLEILVACCECPEPEYRLFSNEAMLVTTIDNSLQEPRVVTTDSIPVAAFGLLVHVERSLVACGGRRQFLLNGAYAMSCLCEDIIAGPRDTVSSIGIHTINELSDDYPAGSDVSHLFMIRRSRLNYASIDESDISNPSGGFFNGKEFMFHSEVNVRTLRLEILLIEGEGISGFHQFAVRLEYSNGGGLEAQSTAVKLY